MTKTVRIENADSNMEKMIIVEYWEKSLDEFGNRIDRLIKIEELTYPTTLFSYALHDTNWLIIKEKDKNT